MGSTEKWAIIALGIVIGGLIGATIAVLTVGASIVRWWDKHGPWSR